MKKVVLHHIASDIGKNSSVGYRSQIIYENSKDNYEITILCRKSFIKRTNNIWTIDLVFLLSRIFLFIRFYIFRFKQIKYWMFFGYSRSVNYDSIIYLTALQK